MKILQLLLESRVDYLKDFYLKKYSDKFPTEDNPTILNLIDDVISTIDPTSNKKYSQWLLNNFFLLEDLYFWRLENYILEDGYKWREYLTIYDKVKQRLDQNLRDINKLSLDQLKDIALQYKEKQEEILTKNDYLDKKYKINETNQYLVYMFKTSTEQDFKMYQLVSTNTEWCTRPNYKTFADYINRSPLFVFINKQNRNLKYQFHEEDNQFMDAKDLEIDQNLQIKLIQLIKNYLPEDFALKIIIDNSFGYINKDGKIIAKGFKDAYSFSEGFAWVQFNDNSYGYINKDGKIIAKGFKDVASFSEGFASVKFNDNSWGYINKDGKIYEEDKKILIKNNDPRLKGIEFFPKNL